jgi:ABC-type uncharacterized transport system substrate-binding protein
MAWIVFAALLAVSPGRVVAHPHVWIDAVAEMLFDERQALTGLRVYWAFDELYSAYAVEGLDANGNGELERAELAPLAAENIRNLKDFSYFTYLEVDGQNPDYGDVTDFGMRYVNGRLAMWFVVPLAEPVDPRAHEVAFALYDPTYYISIELADKGPVRVSGEMPDACGHRIVDTETRSESLSLSETFFESLDSSSNFGVNLAQWVRLTCGPRS